MEELAKELAVLQERHDEVNKQIQESMANRQDDVQAGDSMLIAGRTCNVIEVASGEGGDQET